MTDIQFLQSLPAVEIAFVMDKSSSMNQPTDMPAAAVDGFNEMFDAQLRAYSPTNLTLVQFNQETQFKYRSKPVDVVGDMTLRDFVPQGRTALSTAVIDTITDLEYRLQAQYQPLTKDTLVIIAVLTDGQENGSRHSKADVVSAMDRMRRNFDWKFLYLTSSQTGLQDAQQYGIHPQDMSVEKHTKEGKRSNYLAAISAVSNYRAAWEAYHLEKAGKTQATR